MVERSKEIFFSLIFFSLFSLFQPGPFASGEARFFGALPPLPISSSSLGVSERVRESTARSPPEEGRASS